MDPLEKLLDFWEEVKLFFSEFLGFLAEKLHLSFLHFEASKNTLVSALYKQRGKLARRLMHTGMAGLAGVGIIIAPVVAQEFPGRNVNPREIPTPTVVLSASSEDPEMATQFSEKPRDRIYEYTVQPGDTVSSIAEKFGVSQDTIRWQNNLKSKDSIRAGQTLQILPVTGVIHKVQKGDTVYSIARKYDASTQAIVDFPYNTFTNDETFELAIGQTIIVPDGIKPAEVLWSPLARVKQVTPDAGTVTALGNFIWPAGGTITQRFVWYHPGIDIANKAGPDILAADSGRVVIAGWPDGSGYGNRVLIDHGNGYKTLYAHLQSIYVVAGQSVKRGDRIGKMGSTGRSTGTHLHFEIFLNSGRLDPLKILR